MAKSKNTRKPGKRMRSRVRVKIPRKVQAKSPILANPDARRSALALIDPCNAPLLHGVYPGQRGVVSRFSQVYTLSTSATQTAIVAAFNPTSCISTTASVADANAVLTLPFTQPISPGSAFLASNTDSTRCLGACFQIWSNLAPLNVTGTIGMGVLPHRNIVAVSTATPSSLQGALQIISKLTDKVEEVKWRPGANDDNYAPYNANIIAADDGDTNDLVMVLTGLPVSSSISVKVTAIIEWTPKTVLGMGVPITNQSASPVRAHQIAAELDKHDSSWWHGIKSFGNYMWSHGAEKFVGKTTSKLFDNLTTLIEDI